jgi:uncharacterized protein YdcH (DUF465 family)
VELNNELGNPREDVGVIISNVKNVLTEEEKANDAHFNELSRNCDSADGAITGALNKLNNDVTESTKNLNDWKATLASSAKDTSKAETDIKSTFAKLKQNQIAIDKELEDFKVTVTETDQKLSVVKVLRDIITDELLNARAAKGHSFLQLNKFTDKLNELKEMLNNDSDSMYSPLVSVLLELASEQNFTDQGILKKILENINNLEKSLKEFRTQREAGLNNEMKTLKSNGFNLGKIKNAYENMRAQSISKRIDAQHYITFYTNEIAHYNSEKNRKADEKTLLDKLCAFEKLSHTKDKQNLQDFKAKVLPYIVEQIQKIQ